MHTFYQSQTWIDLQKDIFHKPSFTISFGGTTYTGFAKFSTRFGIQAAWYMVHGVSLHSLQTYSAEIMEDVARLKRDYLSKRGDIFFQLGCTSLFDSTKTVVAKTEEYCTGISKKHTYLAHDFRQRYRLVPSRREHMPQATIVLSLQGKEDFSASYSPSCKRYLNKAKKHHLSFSQAKKSDRELFYDMWYAMAFEKGFAIITKPMFLQMMEYLTANKLGTLFLAKHNGAIVSGSVVVFDTNELIYLYGGTNRVFGDIGAHYWLTDKILSWGKDHGYNSFDLLGISAPRSPSDHSLRGVTRFKQAFGGNTYSYVGNFDIVGNQTLYKTFKLLKSIQ